MARPCCPRCKQPLDEEISAHGVCPACAGPGAGSWILLFVFSMAAYLILGLWWQDYLAAAVMIFIAAATFSGYRVGALNMLSLLAGVALAIFLAPHLAPYLAGPVRDLLDFEGLTNRVFCWTLCGILLAAGTMFVVRATLGHFVRRRHWLRSANRTFGGLLGMAEGAACCGILLAGSMLLEPLAQARLGDDSPTSGPDAFSNRVAQSVVSLAQRTRGSVVGPIAQRANPRQRLPEIEQSLLVINDRQALQAFLDHQSVKDLTERPEIQEALDRMAEDPEIQGILEDQDSLNPAQIRKLAGSRRFLEIVDETDLLSKFKAAMADLGPALQEAAEIARRNQSPADD